MSVFFEFANHLGHVAHRAEHTPGAGTVNNGQHDAHDERGQHDAVEAEGKLRHPGFQFGDVRPMPGNVESPKQVNRFVKRLHFLRHLHRQPNHLDEEEHEEHEKSVSKPFRR